MRKEVRVIFPFFHEQKSFSVKLKKGIGKVNPHVRVLCPRLSEGKAYKKGITLENKNPHRPKLLLKNHADSNLQLWSCEGCQEFLLRVVI